MNFFNFHLYCANLCLSVLFMFHSVCVYLAQWKVHVRRPGVIALQNKHTSAHWLAIRDGATIGHVECIVYKFTANCKFT